MSEIAEKRRSRLVLLLAVAALLLILHFYHPPRGGLWTRAFFDSLHVPVFGLIALGMFAALPAHWQLVKRLALAFVVTCALGLLSEAAQIQTTRDASVADLFSDFFGAAGFLLAGVAVLPATSKSTTRRVALLLIALVVIGWPLLPLAKVSAAYLERNDRFPVLVSFDSRLGNAFIRKQNVDIHVGRHSSDGQMAAKITFGDGPWPGITFHDLRRDWRNYADLVIDMTNPEDTPIELNVRVHDSEHRLHGNAYADRFTTAFTLNSGRQVLRISLHDVRQAPRDRPMDMSQVTEVIIFSGRANAGRSLYLHEIRLQ